MGDVALRFGDAPAAAALAAVAVSATSAGIAQVVEANAAALVAVARPAVAASARPLHVLIGEVPAEALPTVVEEKMAAAVEELKGQRSVVIEDESSGVSYVDIGKYAPDAVIGSLAAVAGEGMVMQCVCSTALKAAIAWLWLPSTTRRPTAGSSRMARSRSQPLRARMPRRRST